MTLVMEIRSVRREKGVRFYECAVCMRTTGQDVDWVPPNRTDPGGSMSPLE